jgi:hypothetical protein
MGTRLPSLAKNRKLIGSLFAIEEWDAFNAFLGFLNQSSLFDVVEVGGGGRSQRTRGRGNQTAETLPFCRSQPWKRLVALVTMVAAVAAVTVAPP